MYLIIYSSIHVKSVSRECFYDTLCDYGFVKWLIVSCYIFGAVVLRGHCTGIFSEYCNQMFFLQEVFQETLSHLALCQQHMSCEEAIDWTGTETLEKIKTLMVTSYETSGAGTRHGPVLVQGSHGTGKSSIIGAVYSNCEAWFGRRLLRIVRFSGATPRSAYNLELLRVICQQLCLLLHLSDGFLPKDASFDPLYVNNWFQTLIRRFEETATDELLVILIDDLHRLNPLDSDIVAALSWLPISLPRNVHIVGTTALPPELLKLTPVQRERFRSPDCYIELLPDPGECQTGRHCFVPQ